MDRKQAQSIFKRVGEEFNIFYFHRYYYCQGLPLHLLKAKLRERHGQNSQIYVRVDHVVVLDGQGQYFVYLLVGHHSGKCADFLHE